jgi:hypothetical protein
MKRICGFLDISFSPNMLDGFKHTPQYDRDEIDEDRATAEVKDYDVGEYDREAVEIYKQLVENVNELKM